ncbi:uncharacterized protein LOC115396053 isoform X2 [Salarias fasciatus]|uniref:uncharacterized protein LOC115396053 isoform X2 n=1 Tax=Salarias fasciatus TaxID=181472 RepID=UPI001176E815|nr:uncharacterized protein LOC115396053 isoform X2 [Salarias fasciatus]
MTGGPDCFTAVVGLVVLSLTLLISLCLNVILWIKKGTSSCRDTDDSCCHHVTEEDIISRSEGLYFHGLRHQEQQETPHTHDEQQENPIYGNIRRERREVCYEMMTMQRSRDSTKPDLNYASLDLKMAKKHKKHRHQQSQGRAKLQDQAAARLTPPANSFLEVDADVDACLPSRDTSTMVSHSSIYLNSQQIALEAEEMERERSMEDVGWHGENERQWSGDQEGRDRKDEDGGNNENASAELSNGETLRSSADHFIHSFSQDDNLGD